MSSSRFNRIVPHVRCVLGQKSFVVLSNFELNSSCDESMRGSSGSCHALHPRYLDVFVGLPNNSPPFAVFILPRPMAFTGLPKYNKTLATPNMISISP